MMKNIELINESIQKMANKPSEGAICAAQCIAKEMDEALNSMRIKWVCLPIQNSKTVDVVNATNKPNFVCRIYDKGIWNEVSNLFCDIGDETNANQMELFSDLMEMINQTDK